MVAHANTTMTSRGQTLLGAMRRNLELVTELEKTSPADAAIILEALANHMRSKWPMAVGVVPAALQSPREPRVPVLHPGRDVERAICAEARYRIGIEDGHVVLAVSDVDDAVAGVMTPTMAEQLREDLLLVLAEVLK